MRKTALILCLLIFAAFLGGCVRQGLLVEGGPEEARQYADLQRRLYTGSVEKGEEGKLIVSLSDGITLQGTYTGFRPESGRHCTKSWIENLRADSVTNVVPGMERGYARLAGPSGEELNCIYGWSTPGCTRQGVCRSNNDKYYRLEFQ